MSYWIRYDLSRYTWEVSGNEDNPAFSDLRENFPLEVQFSRYTEFLAYTDARAPYPMQESYNKNDRTRKNKVDEVWSPKVYGSPLKRVSGKRRGFTEDWQGIHHTVANPPVSGATTSRIYHDGPTNFLLGSQAGGTYKRLIHPLTTKGDIFTFDTNTNRLGVGADYTELISLASAGVGLSWFKRPIAYVYKSGNQTGVAAAGAFVSWDSELFDTGALHDTSTNNTRFTLTNPGYYIIFAKIEFDANATGTFRQVFGLKTGATTYAPHLLAPNGTQATHVHAVWAVASSGSDYFEIEVNHDASTNRTLVGGTLDKSFAVCAWVAPL